MKLHLAMLISVCAMAPTGAFAEVLIGGYVVVVNDANYKQLTNNGQNALESEIFVKMKGSTELFIFGTLAKALNHYKTRKEIVTAIGQMKPGGLIDFDYGVANPQYPKLNNIEYFESLGLRTNPNSIYFKAKTDIKASNALKCIEGGTTRTECRTAVDSAILIGHRRALGDAFIDGKIGAGALKIDFDLDFVIDATDTTTVIPGDFLYMKNKDDYEFKAKANGNMFAIWKGECCIAVDGNKYSGLGLLNRTEAEMRGDLQEAYKTDTGYNVTKPLTEIRFVARSRIKIQP